MSGVTVGEGATVNYAIIDDGAQIGAGSTVGRTKASGEKITVIGSDLQLKPASDVPGGEMVDAEWLKTHSND